MLILLCSKSESETARFLIFARSGTLAELLRRECYERPRVKRKKKSEAARKRKYK
ncbi:MAG: 30S ribosomal protein S21 [Clostridia bacterium]|nr:30S ribosomal protein S21 [Clostridia bacterium]